MAKFKVGDMVIRQKIHRWGPFSINPGPYKVLKVNTDTVPETLVLDIIGVFPKDGVWYSDYFDLYEPEVEKGIWIIALCEDGKLFPGLEPPIYTSEEQAKAAAASMTEEYPGDVVLILKVVGKAVTTKATVEMY